MKKKILQLMILGAFWLPLNAGDSHAKHSQDPPSAPQPCNKLLKKCLKNKSCEVYAASEDAKEACKKNFDSHHNYNEACKSGCEIFWEEDSCKPGPCQI